MCNHDEVIHTAISADGNERVRVLYDFDPIQPNGDCYGTVYHRQSRWSEGEVLCHAYKIDPPDINWYALDNYTDGEDQIASILKGEQSVCECGLNLSIGEDGDFHADGECDLASESGEPCDPMFDYREAGIVAVGFGSHDLASVITEGDLKIWGLDPKDATDDHARDSLSDFEAWASGDTYHLVHERRVTVETKTVDTNGNTWFNTDEDWREVDSCGGYYGDEYAIEEAESWVK